MPDLFSVVVPDEGLSLDDLEREYVIYILHLCEGNRSAACRALGISHPRMLRMVRRLGIAFHPAKKTPIVRQEKRKS